MAITVGSVQIEVLPSTATFAAKLRAALARLTGVTVDVSAETKAADAQLKELTRTRAAEIRADANVAAAQAKLDSVVRKENVAKIKAEAETEAANLKLDKVARNRTAHIKAESDGSPLPNIGLLATAIVGLGPALIPLTAVAAGAIGGIGALAVASTAGLGVLVLGLAGVAGALKAVGAAHANAAVEAKAHALAVASASDAVRNAQQSVVSSTAGVGAAIAAADSASIRSADAVALARRGVGDAVRQSALATVAAVASQVAAERSVAQAQRDALQAQKDLTQARLDASRQLEDLAQRTKDGAISERQGVLNVTQARLDLQRVLNDPTSTQLQKQQAMLAVDAALQGLADTQAANTRLAEDKAKADKAGVAGSTAVRNAQQRVTDTIIAQRLAQTAAAAAAAATVQTRLDGARRIADAEHAVTVALSAQADQARSSSAAILSAQDGLRSASQSLVAAQRQLLAANTAVGSSAAAAATAMAALTPAGREFVLFLSGLTPQFRAVRAAAASGILPGLQDAITSLLPFLPAVTDFIGKMAAALGNLFREGAKALGGPVWVKFFDYIRDTAVPAVQTIARTMGNWATGFAGMTVAFAPVTKEILSGLERLSQSFANIGESKGLKDFVAYVAANGPGIAHIVGEIVSAVGHLFVALLPLGGVVLSGLGALASVIGAIPTPILTLLLGLIISTVVAITSINAALKLYETAQKAVKIVDIAVFNAKFALRLLMLSSIPDILRNAAAWVVNTAVLVAQKVALLAGAVAMGVVRGATIAWTAVQWLLNAALTANPIGLIIVAIALLVVGFIYAWKHSETFRKIVTAGFTAVWTAVQFVWQWIRDHWPLLLAILLGPIALAVLFIVKHWHTIKAGAAAVVGYITGRFDTLVKFFTDLPGRIGAVLSSMWNGLRDGFKAALNFIIDAWNKLSLHLPAVEIPGLGKFGGITLDTPNIPRLATGGVFDKATLAVVGEAGPEAVVPLTQPGLLSQALSAGGPAPSSQSGGLTVVVNNPLPERVGESVPKILRRRAYALGV